MNQREIKTNKTIFTFALASFLNDLGSDMIYPVWPLFVTTVLHANMTVLGFLDGLGDALVSLSQGFSGYLSDKFRKRKVFIWLGYLCGSIARIGYALSPTWQSIVPFRVLDRAGKIRSAPRDAMIADVSPQNERGKNFGILRAMDNLGAVCGTVICILFFGVLGYRYLFFLAALPSVVSILLILLLIKETRAKEMRVQRGLSLKELDSNFKLLLLSSSLFALGTFSYSFLLLYAKESSFNAGEIPVLYLIFTAIASLVSFPMGKLSDKIGRKTVLLGSYLLWGIVCVSFIGIRGHEVIMVVFIIYGAHRGALEPVQRAFISELAPLQYRASVLGGFQMVVGLCALPASLIAGILWESVNKAMPLYFSLILTVLSAILLLFVKECQAR